MTDRRSSSWALIASRPSNKKAIFAPLERLFAINPKKFLRRGVGVDLIYYFLSGLLPAVLLSGPMALVASMAHHLVPASLLTATAGLPIWERALLGLVAGEIGYYWGHRLCHEIPFLWGFHSIHHSATEVDFLVNTRAHPVDITFGRFCGLVPMYALGLGGPIGAAGSAVPIIVTMIGVLWGFFIHANLRWRFGPLEWLVSTPAFHHWHHTLDGPINRNYSSTLPWLDWIFGTLHLPRHEWPSAYGVSEKVPDTLGAQLAYPVLREESPAGSSSVTA